MSAILVFQLICNLKQSLGDDLLSKGAKDFDQVLNPLLLGAYSFFPLMRRLAEIGSGDSGDE